MALVGAASQQKVNDIRAANSAAAQQKSNFAGWDASGAPLFEVRGMLSLDPDENVFVSSADAARGVTRDRLSGGFLEPAYDTSGAVAQSRPAGVPNPNESPFGDFGIRKLGMETKREGPSPQAGASAAQAQIGQAQTMGMMAKMLGAMNEAEERNRRRQQRSQVGQTGLTPIEELNLAGMSSAGYAAPTPQAQAPAPQPYNPTAQMAGTLGAAPDQYSWGY